MRPKRWLALAAAVLTAGATATACSSGPGSSDDPNTLRVSATSADRPAMEAVIAQFKEANPDVTVNAEYLGTEEMQAAMRTQLSAGTAWDVMLVWPGNGNAGALHEVQPYGYLEDLSNQPWAQKIPEGLKTVTQYEGKTYLLPMAFSGIGAIYNLDTMDEIGAEIPDTWTGLLEFCDLAKSKDKAAFSLGNQTEWVTQLINYALVATTVYATTPDFDAQMQSGAANFVGSGWETSMSKYLEMNDRGCFQKDPLGTTVEATESQVAGGDAVAVVQGTWELGNIKKQAPEGTELTMAPLPATDNPDETNMPGATSGTYALNAKSANKELGLKFMEFMSTPAAMNAWATAGGSLPAFPNDEFSAGPELAQFIEFQTAGRTVPFMDQLWPSAEVQATHLTGVQDIFAGNASPADVLGDMDEAYDKGAAE